MNIQVWVYCFLVYGGIYIFGLGWSGICDDFDRDGCSDHPLVDGWLRMGLLPPPHLGNFADISYLVDN